jgi:thiamine-phosphate pyrophosphorylase
VGLGPFRFTYTKKKLNPKLGYEGYEQILFKLKISNKKIPIIAIGGIIDTDIEKLMGSNIHGIAAAAAILEKEEIEINVQKYQQKIDA